MRPDRERQALDLFQRLLDADSDEREVLLKESGADDEVCARVRALVQADAHAQGLLDKEAGQHLANMSDPDLPSPTVPEQIGNYRIVQTLGEGGMATVYEAQRVGADFEQTVALKLISPLRQSEHWQQRFIQERQILASLQHPNIAILLDGGIADTGQPYFAMEYVSGKPITEYCDERRLGISRRISLMLAVCDAVSYAHRNLIVHRDLKPSNILVDENGQPRLLDFGIAKILTEEADDTANRTQTSMRALTPDYAAPEQFVGGSATTAVDVYALGGLLFELLCGHRPFARQGRSALDIEREIRDRGAPTFSDVGQKLTTQAREKTALQRSLSWRRLQRSISGDLEKIVLKALRREPERRYASVDALAADLRRYLDGQPVQARPDTLGYRLGKLAARHPVGFPLGAVAIVGLITLSLVATNQARVAELEAAKANETRDFVTSLFEFAGPDKSLGEQLTARQLLDLGAIRIDQQLAGQPELHAEMTLLLANTYGQLGLYDTAKPFAEQAVGLFQSTDDDGKRFDALLALARLHRQTGTFAEAAEALEQAAALGSGAQDAGLSTLLVERGELNREQAQFDSARVLFEQALAIDRERLAPPADLARDLFRLGTLEFSAGDSNLGLELLREAAAALSGNGIENTTQYAAIRHDIGVMLIQRGALDDARAMLESVRDLRQQLLGDEHPDLAVTLKELAGIARQQGESEKAESLYLAALAINETILGSEHPETANNLNSLAVFYRGLGRDEIALTYAQRALSGATQAYGEQHPTVGLMTVNVGAMQRMLGRLDEAYASTQAGLDILVAALGENHHLAGVGYNALAGVQHDKGQLSNAEPNYRRALTVFESTAGAKHPHTVSILNGLGRLLVDSGRIGEAKSALQRAVDTATEALPAGHPTTATVQIGLAYIAAVEGRCEDALALWQTYGEVAQSTPAWQSRIRNCQ